MMIYAILYTQLECKNLNMISFEPNSDTIKLTSSCFNDWYKTCYKDNISKFKTTDEIKKSMKVHIENQFK